MDKLRNISLPPKWFSVTIFKVAVTLCGIFLMFCELLLPSEQDYGFNSCEPYQGSFVRVMDDGSKVPISIPIDMPLSEVENNHVIIETVLDIGEDETTIAFRSVKQVVNVWLDDELIQTYDTRTTQPFGKNPVGGEVFVKLNMDDSGKTLRVEFSSYSKYAGFIDQFYQGSQMGIWLMFIKANAFDCLFAFIIILIAIVTVLISDVMRRVYSREMPLEFLAFFVSLAAMWLISENMLRQALFPNYSAAAQLRYLALKLLSIPLALYLNALQENRYRILFYPLFCLSIIDFIVSWILQLTNIADFADTLIPTFAILGILMVVTITTIIMDIISKQVKSYMAVAIGLLGMVFFGVLQLYSYMHADLGFSGSYICWGLMFLFLMAIIQTMTELGQLERLRLDAIAESQSKARFLANMSHEIRTPINAVLGMNKMILNECADESILDYSRDIDAAGRNLLTIINDILDFSKIEAGNIDLILTEYSVKDIINECYQMVELKAADKGLEVSVSIQPSMPDKLLGDDSRIKQIIINILNNAIKYTREGSVSVVVTGEETGDDRCLLRVAIADTGIGIAPENIDKIFTSYQRVDEGKNKAIEGTGLGLSITKQFVEMMNGNILVESVYGQGSTFTVEIPQIIMAPILVGDFKVGMHIRKEDGTLPVQQPTASFTAPSAKILVVDDVPVNIKVMQGLLKKTKADISSAQSGQEAIDKVKVHNDFDIIFLDHMMPGMDGIETLQELKKMPGFDLSKTPVIMLTANAMQGAKEEYMSKGFVDYLSKPISEDKLYDVLHKYLKSGKVNEDTALEIPPVVSVDQRKIYYQFNYLDMDVAMKNCSGSMDTFIEIVTTYVSTDIIEELQNAFKNRDYKSYETYIHGLKSSSRYIGAIDFGEECYLLEKSAKREEWVYIAGNHDRIISQYGILLGQLKHSLVAMGK